MVFSAQVEANTTGADQTVRIPGRLYNRMSVNAQALLSSDTNGHYFLIHGAAPSLADLFPNAVGLSTTPLGSNSSYVVAAFNAQIQLGGSFTVDGNFGLTASSAGFQLYVGASVDVGPLGSMGAAGMMTIEQTLTFMLDHVLHHQQQLGRITSQLRDKS